MLFGSDTPFDPGDGMFLQNSVRSVASLPITDDEKQAIFSGNAAKLLRLPSGAEKE